LPIQTVVIETDSPYLGKGWPLWKLPPVPVVFRARLGERFEPGTMPEQLSARMEEYFRRSCAVNDPRGTHLVIIPSYNTGAKVYENGARGAAQWAPVWVVVDGSDDGTAEGLQRMAAQDPQLKVIVLPVNRARAAPCWPAWQRRSRRGFTHALAMDSDGQHPADLIPAFMHASQLRPDAMILGRPVFDASAPLLRVRGRRVSNGWTNLEDAGRRRRRLAVRVPRVSHRGAGRCHATAALDAPLRLRHRGGGAPRVARRGPRQPRCAGEVPAAREGGVSHFNYLRDNALLTWMHARLMLEFLLRLPLLTLRRLRGLPPLPVPRPALRTVRPSRR
jgi:hypothetical protein